MTRAEVTHPLDETLAQFAGENEKSPGPLASFGPLTGSGWYLASDLLADEGALDEVIECYGARRETTWPFLQAALLMHPYVTPVVSAAVYGLYAGGRVLDVSAENLAIRLDDSGDIAEHAFRSRRFAALTSDPAARHPDATSVPDRESLIAWMFDCMIERHMRPFFSRVRAKTKHGQPPWGESARRVFLARARENETQSERHVGDYRERMCWSNHGTPESWVLHHRGSNR